MITRWSTAHDRLLEQLPRRTHHQRAARRHTRSQAQAANATNGRPITVAGKVYKTFTSAYRALHISPYTLRGWLASGKAKHVQSKPKR
jgi:hypothetical protein